MIWRLIDSGRGDAYWNMALDEALLKSFPKSQIPTLRFYQWSSPTLSLGYFQSIAEVDLEGCRRRGYEFVRRPTGGGAVLHDEELTYSFVCPIEELPEGVTGSHRAISEALALGLRHLGLQPELALKRESGKSPSPACFAFPSSCEIVIAGKKVIGSAQTRNKEAMLQHGSIPLKLELSKLMAVLKAKAGDLEALRQRAAGLNEFSARELTIGEVKEAIRLGFEERFKIKFLQGELTLEELQQARRLVQEKYGTLAWNFRR